jgi:voltage-gated potassium channel
MTKEWFRQLLVAQQSIARSYFDLFMMLLVTSSVVVLMLQVRYSLGAWTILFEQLVVSLFIAEYLLRLWIFNDWHKLIDDEFEQAQLSGVPINGWKLTKDLLLSKWHFVTQPMAMVDLLAIIPAYRPLRLLRFVVLFRLFKLMRYSRTLSQFGRIIADKQFEIRSLMLFVLMIILIAGSALYLFEGQNNNKIQSLFDAFYWALVTVSTVGYGDITPVSTEGRVITMVLIIVGVGVVAFITSTIVTAFNSRMPEIHRDRFFAELEKKQSYVLLCGYGKMGQAIASLLIDKHYNLVILDNDSRHIDSAIKQGLIALHDDPTSSRILERCQIKKKVSHVLCVSDDDVNNLYMTLSIRQLNKTVPIISCTEDTNNEAKMIRAGATKTINPSQLVAGVSLEFAGQPIAFDAVSSILSGVAGVGLETLVVQPSNRLAGQSLAHLKFSEHRLVLLGVVSQSVPPASEQHYMIGQQVFMFNPALSYILQDGDNIVVIGHYQSANYFMEQWS